MEPDLDLAYKFLMEFLPPDAQEPIHEVFTTMKKNPHLLLSNGIIFNQMEYFRKADKRLSIAAVNGVISGFALAYAMRYPEIHRMLQGYIDQAGKERGENVVNFFQKKGFK